MDLDQILANEPGNKFATFPFTNGIMRQINIGKIDITDFVFVKYILQNKHTNLK